MRLLKKRRNFWKHGSVLCTAVFFIISLEEELCRIQIESYRTQMEVKKKR